MVYSRICCRTKPNSFGLHRRWTGRTWLVAVGAIAAMPVSCVEEERLTGTVAEAEAPSLGSPEIFDPVSGRISDAKLGRDGTVYVADLQTSSLYGMTGQARRVMGRRGSGPGEFQMLTGLAVVGDTLIAFDPQLSRLTYFPLGSPSALVASATISADDGMHASGAPIPDGDGGVILARAKPAVEYDVVNPGRIQLSHYTRDGSLVADSLAVFRGPDWLVTPGRTSGYTVEPMPFGSRPLFDMSAGRLFYMWGGGIDLTVRDLATGDSTAIALPVTPRLVEEADVNSYVHSISGPYPSLVSRQVARTKAAYAEGKLPEQHPVADVLIGDGEGRVWIQLVSTQSQYQSTETGSKYMGADGIDLMVVDVSDRTVSRVHVPGAEKLLDVNGEYLLVLMRDSLDVERVARIPYSFRS